jgi:hypothetical protein
VARHGAEQGVTAIVAGIVAPMINGTVGGPNHMGAWFAFRVDLIALAQVTLGKDLHMSVGTYWLIVPLRWHRAFGWAWLRLTRHHHNETKATAE